VAKLDPKLVVAEAFKAIHPARFAAPANLSAGAAAPDAQPARRSRAARAGGSTRSEEVVVFEQPPHGTNCVISPQRSSFGDSAKSELQFAAEPTSA